MNKRPISFASLVKEEAAKAERSDEEKRSLLSAFVRINGYLRLRNGREGLEVASESAAIAKAIYQYLHDLYGVGVRFAYTRSAGLLKRIVYHVIVDEDAKDILSDLGVDFFNFEFPKSLVATDNQRASYLAGAFLASGSVNSPESSDYHLEIALQNEALARWLLKLWAKFPPHPFTVKLVKRRQQFVLYLKRGDEISDFLVLIGAKENCLRFEDVRVGRDFANIGNRLENLDAANYAKSQRAGERQVEEINFFLSSVGWERIDNPKLKALMKLRLDHPDATLADLAKDLSEELASSVTKSNVNHLFRYLDSEYQKAKK